ncbi:hypothetical protein [Burkholderia ubonensis]|uniref:hypothetical protein n=1 Tax=Burkholderia ubonensis TaxID=101571 RepID=UPI000BA7D77E|nr:hypothetical protein [Burkholderia ubonensis]PAK11017.1 hypothetical protein CJO66_30180 [Burkholderia ubonensis]RQP27509.1 hypothetical protein DF155_32175 [Burkholderia ubonensis]RQP29363.1 hypothetical protein DF154_32980 [Burkholderia ubonensis]RQP31337.1 hypothetical protein DF156_31965 [Burkholderia ubonensis]RQP47279.1 hypothetical protein DF144_32190 [Burkholderia ubonensis]
MTTAARRQPRHRHSPLDRAVLGVAAFAIGGPLVAALVAPTIALIIWSVFGQPFWGILKIGAGMAVVILFGSFRFGYFVPIAVTGGIMSALGARVRRRWFVLLGMLVGTATMIGYVVLDVCRMHTLDDEINGLDVIVIADAFITSGVLSGWLHRRLARQAQASEAVQQNGGDDPDAAHLSPPAPDQAAADAQPGPAPTDRASL